MRRFLKENRRSLLMLMAMTLGVTFYPPLSRFDAALEGCIAPVLIFAMLFVTFCKVRMRDLRFRPIHLALILFQIVAAPLSYYMFLPFGEVVAQGAMACFLAPIAMAAVAVGALMGANVITLVSYTLICNVVMSFVIPVFLNLFGNGECTVAEIFVRVVPLLVAPIVVAQTLKRVWRRAAKWIGARSQMAFYMWLFLMMVTLARTTNFTILHFDQYPLSTMLMLAAVALFACLVQYGLGKAIGSRFDDRVAGGQSLGQKNTVLTVWLAQTFLSPISSIAPTAYIIWQNIVNSYQIYRHDKRG